LLLAAITLLAAFLRFYRIHRLPPGDGYDPAVYGLDALDILAGARPVYLASNFGREALFSYLVALSVRTLGVGPYAIYIASAVAGTLTIPAVYLLACEFFAADRAGRAEEAGDRLLRRWGGLLAALATAFSYWHLSWSRLGVRAILVPLFAALTMGLFFHSQRTGRRWATMACGVALGLSLYTYQAAWLLPVLVALGFAYAAVARWKATRRAFARRDAIDLLVVFVAAAIVFAPMGAYLATHPGVSTVRVEQTLALQPSEGALSLVRTLWEQGKEAVSVLLFRGDNWPKVNPPGRALLNPFLVAALLLGLAVALARSRRRSYLLLLTWLVVMIAPALLAHSGPASKRAIGTLPAAMVLIGLGCLVPANAVHRWLEPRYPTLARVGGVGLAALIAGGFLYSGVRTYRDYFAVWGQDPSLFTYFEAGLSATGQYIAQRPAEEQVYLSSVSPSHPSVSYNARQRPDVKGYNGRVCLVVADRPAGGATYVIAPAEDKRGLEQLEAYQPQGSVIDEGPLHYGQPYYLAYHVPAGAPAAVEPAFARQVNWGDQLELLGYDLARTSYQPGQAVHLTTYTRATSPEDGRAAETDYTVFVHLLGPHNPATGGPLWAQDDSEPCRRTYPTSDWGPDEIVVDHWALHIPPDALPGEYQVAVGFYHWPTLERLPVLDKAGEVVGDHVVLTLLQVKAGD
jgi:4-amino-4-deoxy-L-arabinose transferase-like glycosyltransferase